MDRLIELVRLCQDATQREEFLRAADELYLLICAPLRQKITRMCPPAMVSLVDDVFQETLGAVICNLEQSKFKGEEKRQFWGWCFRIAQNKAIDALRKRKIAYLPPSELEALKPVIEASLQAGSDDSHLQEKLLTLAKALKNLEQSKPTCFQYLWRLYFEQQDLGTMAEDYRIKYDTMRMRVERCTNSLRLLYEAEHVH